MRGKVFLKQTQPLITSSPQAQFVDHKMNSADPAAVYGPALLGHFIMDVARRHDRLRLIAPDSLGIQAALNSLLAVAQDFGIGSHHSKCCFFLGGLVLSPPSNQGLTGISSFLRRYAQKITLL